MSDVNEKIVASRAELEATLDAIEDRLNVPKRFGELKTKVTASYRSNPVPWLVGAAGAVLGIAALITAAIVSDD